MDNSSCCTGAYHNCGAQDTDDRRGFPCVIQSGLCDNLRPVWWLRTGKDGLSFSGREDKAQCDTVMNKCASSRQAVLSREMYMWVSDPCMSSG